MYFERQVVDAVLRHMNDDHAGDSLAIVRAFGAPAATAATMTGLDQETGLWRATTADGEHDVRVAWPGGMIAERAEIRREVVALYAAACARLGETPSPH